MVFEGTKICAISSSENGKGNKIRKGSLGYLSGVGIQSHVGRNTSVTIVPARIIFTRFGLQDRERSESKLVHLVFPLDCPDEMKNPLRHLDKLTKVVQGVRPNVNGVLASLSGHNRVTGKLGHAVAPTKIPAIVVKEVCSDITSSENEFKSWLKSVLSGLVISNVLFSNKDAKINRAYKVLEKANPEFKQMLTNKKLKNLVDDLFALDIQDRIILVNALKCMLNLYKSSLINTISNPNNCFMSMHEINFRTYPLYWQMGQINEYFRSAPSKYYHLRGTHRSNINKWLKFLENISI